MKRQLVTVSIINLMFLAQPVFSNPPEEAFSDPYLFPKRAVDIEYALGESSTTRGAPPKVASVPPRVVAAPIMFAHNSAEIQKESFGILLEYVKAFKGGLAGRKFRIVGHTDSKGGDEFNLKLSKRRAQSVKDFLVTIHGIQPEFLESDGCGKQSLLHSPEKGEKERKENRRVEFQKADTPLTCGK